MKFMNLINLFLAMLLAGNSVSATASTIEFFYSNNTDAISVETAYERLTGNAQQSLHKETDQLMKSNKIHEEKNEDILGTYSSAKDPKITADNTEILRVTFAKKISLERIFAVARKIADTFNQESVAVFIADPNKMVSDVKVVFTVNKPTISEAIKWIHEKLPSSYSRAYSLHIENESADYLNARITAIEWLGHKVKWNELKQAFPDATISYQYGKSYLIYRNGKVESL